MIRATYYCDNQIQPIQFSEIDTYITRDDGAVWIDVYGHTPQGLDLMRSTLRFHELAIEDVHNQEQRPKVEEFTDHLLIILNTVEISGTDCNSREVDVFVGKNYLVTVHPHHEPLIEQAQARIMPDRLLFEVSSTYLLYIMLDTVVDSYLPVLEHIETEIDTLSTQLLNRPNAQMQLQLFALKRTLNQLWWIVWPQADILNVLMNHELVFIDKKSQYYLRDVSDHVLRISNLVQISRDSITELINLYASSISNQLNLAVNRLTIFTVIFGVLAVVGGFYGMNFQRTWPPFEADWGVPAVIALMLTLSIGIYLLLQRRHD